MGERLTNAQTLSAQSQGLTFIKQTTFAGVSSVAVDNVFSKKYDNYFLTFQTTGSAATGIATLQFRSGGTTQNANYGNMSAFNYTTANVYMERDRAGTDEIDFTVVGATHPSNVWVTAWVGNPFRATATNIVINGTGNFGANIIYYVMSYGILNTTTLCDGFIVNMPSTMTGYVRVYGLKGAELS